MLNFIDRWYDKIKPYLFKYKDGFFELPYLGNTPLSMIESFRKMPFIQHDDAKKRIISNSPFVDAIVSYHVINNDLIFMHSVLMIKANICFKSIIKKEITEEYYCLTYTTNLDESNSSKRIIYGEQLENSTLQLIKPTVNIKTYHFKNAHFESFLLYFTEKWLLDFCKKSKSPNEKILEFIHSKDQTFISNIDNKDFFTRLLNEFKSDLKLDFDKRDNKLLNSRIIEFLQLSIHSSFTKSFTNQYFHISNSDRTKIEEVEKILEEHITTKFPGIEKIAHQIGVSETKLKYLFKQQHQLTLLGYYQEKKMQAAEKMLAKGEHKVSEVANYFGYSNASKFSAMFKNHINSLPSEVNSENRSS